MLDVGIQVKLDGSRAISDSAQLFKNLERAAAAAGNIKIPSGANNSSQTFNATAAAANNAAATTLKLSNALAQLNTQAGATSITFRGLNSVMQQYAGIIGQVATQNLQFQNAVVRINPGLQQQSGLLAGLTARAIAFAASYFTINEALKVGAEIIESREQLDRLEVGLKAIAPDARTAAAAEAFLIQETQRMGLQISETIPEFIKMSAAFQQSGFSFGQTEKIFTDISTATKALGLSSATTNRVLYDFQEMASLGVVQMRQLRMVLMQVPGGFEIASRAMGVTTEQLHKLISAGQVDPAQFIPAFTAELAKTYGQELPAALDTLESHVNRLKNSWTLLLGEIGRNPGIKYVTDAANTAVQALTPNNIDRERIAAYRKDLLFNPQYNNNTSGDSFINPYDIIGSYYNPQTYLTDDEIKATLQKQDQLRALQHQRVTLRNGGAIQDFIPKQPITDQEAFGTDAQRKNAQKFWEIYDQMRTASLTGEDKQRQEIIDKFSSQLRKISEGDEIPGRNILVQQIQDAQKYALAQFDQNSQNRSITSQVGDSLDSMKQIAAISKDLKIEIITDDQVRKIAEVNKRFDDMKAAALYADMNANYVVDPSIYNNIEAARQNALNQLRPQKTAIPFLGQSLTSLESQRQNLQSGLSSAKTQEDYEKMATEIQNINKAMTLKLESDNNEYFDSFKYGIQSVVDSFQNASQSMAQIGSTLASSIDKNLTDALTSMALGTKKPADAFREMALSIVGDLEKIVIETTIVQPLIKGITNAFGLTSGASGIFAGLFAGGSSTATPSTGMIGNYHLGDVQHLGGIAGMRRMHGGGLVGDEVPIVARKDEGIFTPEQMKAMGKVMGGGNSQVIRIMNVSNPNQVSEELASNPDLILNPIFKKRSDVNKILGKM